MGVWNRLLANMVEGGKTPVRSVMELERMDACDALNRAIGTPQMPEPGKRYDE